MKDVDCPYCGSDQEICHDDGYGYEEYKVYDQYCSSCDKTFAFTTSISFYYEATKAACMNGGDHEWSQMKIFPLHWPDAKRCDNCGKEIRGEFIKDPNP